jgi:curved DNA-binding protein CbpA
MTQRFLPYSPERDIYRLLQVDPRAGSDEMLDAWRRLARTFHPDHNESMRAHEEMQVVNAVRDLITNPTARAQYDRERRRWMTDEPTGAWRTISRPTHPIGVQRRKLPEPASPGSFPGPGRFARAVGLGMVAFGAALLPARCERCGGAISRTDQRCWICGFPTRAPRT